METMNGLTLTQDGRPEDLKPEQYRAVHFDSIESFMSAVAERPKIGELGKNSRSLSEGRGEISFRGTATYVQAVQLASEGWPEGLASVDKFAFLNKAIQGFAIARNTLERDVAGFMPEVPSFLQGRPDSMVRFERVEQAGFGKVIRMNIELGASCGLDQEAFSARGAVTVAAIDALERAGYSVELTISGTTAADNERERGEFGHAYVRLPGRNLISVSFVAKQAGEHIDRDRLMFFTMHRASLRRIFFGLQERLGVIEFCGECYGTVVEQGVRPDTQIHTPGVGWFAGLSERELIANATRWVSSVLSKQGIEFDASAIA